MKLIDVHAHLQFPQFAADREEVIRRTTEAGIGVINIGTDLKTSEAAIRLAEENENMWATVGLHPADLAEGFDAVFYRELAKGKKVVGIGECGLDYFRADPAAAGRQKEIFVQQIHLANELNLPLMLHIRQAYRDAYEILKTEARVKGNVHFFAGSWEEAKKFIDLGFTLSFSGVITFPPLTDTNEVLKNIPLDRILAETDSPFAAPCPWRGRRNEPSYVRAVISRLAALRGESEEEMAAICLRNAASVFALPI